MESLKVLDGMPSESTKADLKISVDTCMLYNLFGKIWEEENVPKEWKHGYLIKLANKWRSQKM